MNLSVIIPTVAGREKYLDRCLRGYKERTYGVEGTLEFIQVPDAETCGQAWQYGAAVATGDYLHFTADDIVPGENWLPGMVGQVGQGNVPVPLVITATPEVLDEDDFPVRGNPLTPVSNFLERPSGPAVIEDGYVCQGESEYPSVPFCSREQWQDMGPMIAAHYGTDRWFGLRAKAAGFPNVVTHGSCFYHYAAHAGRVPKAEEWLHLDRLTFELNIAFPMYAGGQLAPHETHPLYGTPEGRQLARDWYAANVPPPWYWQANL